MIDPGTLSVRVRQRAIRIFELSNTIGSIESADVLPAEVQDAIIKRAWAGLHRLGIETMARSWDEAVGFARGNRGVDPTEGRPINFDRLAELLNGGPGVPGQVQVETAPTEAAIYLRFGDEYGADGRLQGEEFVMNLDQSRALAPKVGGELGNMLNAAAQDLEGAGVRRVPPAPF